MKKILIAVLIMTFALSFAGCGDKSKSAVTNTNEPTEEMTEETTEQTDPVQENEPTGNQLIQMGNVQIQIPSKWEYSESDSKGSEDVYASRDGNTIFTIRSIQEESDLDGVALGESMEEYLEELGYQDIGYDDITVAGIEGKFTSVDKSMNPNGMYQQLVGIGKGTTFTVISCQQTSDDFTEFDRALDTLSYR